MRFLLGHDPDISSKQALEEAFILVIEIKGHYKYYLRWTGDQSLYYFFGWRIHKFVNNEKDQIKQFGTTVKV